MTEHPLVHLLRCVECGGELAVPTNPARLVCAACETFYETTGGVVRMLSGTAREDPGRRRTAESFAYEWSRFGGLRPEWEQNFRDYLRPLTPDELSGRLVLDAGAGSGRHSFHAARAGATVVTLDGGPAIDVARRNLPPEVLTVQADAEALPFAPGSFDVALCIGVLHHLPDPSEALRALAHVVRPGGRVHIYVYWVPGPRWQRALLRAVSASRRVTTRLPHRMLHAICYPVSAVLAATFVWPHRALRGRPRGRRIAAALPLKAYADYPFGVLVNDQFDRFSAPIERRYTADEVEEMMRGVGLTDVVVVANHGWVADGTTPRPVQPRAAV
jgi:SAM-dependent methyltransferase